MKSVKYGTVSFAPVKPKKHVNISEAAVLSGRPRAIPVLSEQPTVKENAFFERARAHLAHKDLQADKGASNNRRHTPWMEFLKILHLYSTQLVSKDELNSLLQSLFTQGLRGSVPSGEIAASGATLLVAFKSVIDNRGPFAAQERANLEKAQANLTNLKRTFEVAKAHDEAAAAAAAATTSDKPDDGLPPSKVKVVTPSYCTLPADYPRLTRGHFTDREASDHEVLNDDLVTFAKTFKETHNFESRSNVHESVLFDLEDQRYEMDMAIDANTATIRQMEPVYQEINFLRRQEEADGQPIGRMQYKLLRRTFTTSHVAAIARIYGASGDLVLEHLKQNPAAVIPVVMDRLKQKDAEWRLIRTQMNIKWRSLHARVLKGSCDFEAVEVKKALTAKHEEAEILKPWVVSAKKTVSTRKFNCDMVKLTYSLMSLCADSDIFDTDLDCSRVWCEFFLPFFALDTVTLLKETHAEYLPPVFPVGLTLMTSFGVGKVLYYSNDKQFYRIQLPYGVAWLNPNSIFYPIIGVPDVGDKDDELRIYARHNHRLKQLTLPDVTLKRRKLEKLVGGNVKATPLQKAYVTKKMYTVLELFYFISESLEKVMNGFNSANRKVLAATSKGKKLKVSVKSETAASSTGASAAGAEAANKDGGDVVMADADKAVANSSSPSSSSEKTTKDPAMKKIAPHLDNPDKFKGFCGLLRERIKNDIDQAVYESGCAQLMNDSMVLGELCYIPDLIVRATDAMLAIIGSDDDKEGSGNGFLRDAYLTMRNYVVDEEAFITALRNFSRNNNRHGDFMESVFEVSYDVSNGEYRTKYISDTSKLIEGYVPPANVKREREEADSADAAQPMDVDGGAESGTAAATTPAPTVGGRGRSKRVRS